MEKISFNKSKKVRPITAITWKLKGEIEEEKKRPHTSLKPIPRNVPITNTNTGFKKDNNFTGSLTNSRNFNIDSNKNFRPIRATSSYRDREFNKFWKPDKTNTLSVNSITVRPLTGQQRSDSQMKENSKSNFIKNDTDFEFDLLNRNLYKFSKIDWESKKDFNFLTSIGGAELSLANNSILTTEPTNRPSSGIGYVNSNAFNSNKNKRPNTGHVLKSNLNNPKTRLLSGVKDNSLSNNTGSKFDKRPMTAINKLNTRLNSGRIITPNLDPIRNIHNEDNNYLYFSNESAENLKIEELVGESMSDCNSHATPSANGFSIATNKQVYYPRVESLLRNFKNLDIKNYSIKIQAADSDILDIFDRSQRTTAATLSKIGDFEYYTAHQRIGIFMEFSAQLTRGDLKKIGMFFNNNDHVSYLTSNKNSSNMVKKKDPMITTQQSLFHGKMRKEFMRDKINPNNRKDYDPAEYLKVFTKSKNHDPSTWPEDFSKKIKTSLNNYEKYLNSNKILYSDIYPFDSNLRKKFLKLVDLKLQKENVYLIEECIIEIENEYYITLKKILFDYVLRSPFERKRLNIQWLPKKSQTSSEIIAENGSFNRSINKDWLANYTSAFDNLSKNMGIFSIISSAMCDWIQSFNHINLFYIKKVKNLILAPYGTLHLMEFNNIQISHLKKSFHFFKDIFYRGAISIIRKNKMFKRNIETEGKWTFKGFITKKGQEDQIKLSNNISGDESSLNGFNSNNFENYSKYSNASIGIKINYDDDIGMDYSDQIDDFWSNFNIDDLVDIRVNPSYFAYTTLIQKKSIDLNSYLYDYLTVDQKINLNNSITSQITIFFRQIVEKSIHQFSEYILSFPLMSKLMENYPDENIFSMPARTSRNLNLNHKLNDKLNQISPNHSALSNTSNISNNYFTTYYDLNSEIYYKEKEIKLPNLKAFMIKDRLDPIINIKSKYDESFSQIRLEYTCEEVVRIFSKLFENCVTFFNSLYMTHFVEFKQNSQTDLEKINKQHWIRLNEVFLESKLEINKAKTFLDDYYENICPNIIIEETKVKELRGTMRVALINEETFIKMKNKITTHIRNHYSETEEYQKIFEPLHEIISTSLSENIKNFLEIDSEQIDYRKFKNHIEKLRTCIRYLCTIPNNIKFSFFSIDISDTKKELLRKSQDMLNSLFNKLENIIFSHYGRASDLFYQVHKQINKSLITPEELVEMEMIKSNISNDLGLIDKQLEDANNIYQFLIIEDHIFSDNLITQGEEILLKNQKFLNDLDEIQKMHNEDKEKLENNFLNAKKILLKDLQEFEEIVNSLDGDVHLTDHLIILDKVYDLESYKESLKNRIEISLKEEELLFAYKMEGFDSFDLLVKKLEKISIMWKNSSIFYDLRKKIILNFSEDLDILHSLEMINNLQSSLNINKTKLRKEEEIVGKLTKIVDEDIEIFKEFMQITNNVITSEGDLNSETRRRVTDLMESRKLDPTYLIPHERRVKPSLNEGVLDNLGFFRSPNGSFWDPDDEYFNRNGFDIHAGCYSHDFEYVPGPEWLPDLGYYPDEKEKYLNMKLEEFEDEPDNQELFEDEFKGDFEDDNINDDLTEEDFKNLELDEKKLLEKYLAGNMTDITSLQSSVNKPIDNKKNKKSKKASLKGKKKEESDGWETIEEDDDV